MLPPVIHCFFLVKIAVLEEKIGNLESRADNTALSPQEQRLNRDEFTTSRKKQEVYLLAHSADYQTYESDYRFIFNKIRSNAGINFTVHKKRNFPSRIQEQIHTKKENRG